MSKIKEILESKNSVIVFDVDGVLAPLEYGEYNHYYANDEEWAEEIERGTDFYDDVRVIKTMKDFIDTKNINNIYVITKAMNEKEFECKIRFLSKNYGILKDNCYMVYKDNEKLNRLDEIRDKTNIDDRLIVMVEDTVSILNHIMENSKYTTVHISTFLK